MSSMSEKSWERQTPVALGTLWACTGTAVPITLVLWNCTEHLMMIDIKQNRQHLNNTGHCARRNSMHLYDRMGTVRQIPLNFSHCYPFSFHQYYIFLHRQELIQTTFLRLKYQQTLSHPSTTMSAHARMHAHTNKRPNTYIISISRIMCAVVSVPLSVHCIVCNS